MIIFEHNIMSILKLKLFIILLQNNVYLDLILKYLCYNRLSIIYRTQAYQKCEKCEKCKQPDTCRVGRNIGKRMKRNLERSKRLDSSPERLSTRKRKAEVIDAGIPFPSLWRNRASKGSRKLDGEVGSKTRKLQFIHQSLD